MKEPWIWVGGTAQGLRLCLEFRHAQRLLVEPFGVARCCAETGSCPAEEVCPSRDPDTCSDGIVGAGLKPPRVERMRWKGFLLLPQLSWSGIHYFYGYLQLLRVR